MKVCTTDWSNAFLSIKGTCLGTFLKGNARWKVFSLRYWTDNRHKWNNLSLLGSREEKLIQDSCICMDLHLSILLNIFWMLSLVFFYVSTIYMTTDYDCSCIHEKMLGLRWGVHESYARFTVCALTWGRKYKLLKKKFKKGLREQALYPREQGLCQKGPSCFALCSCGWV